LPAHLYEPRPGWFKYQNPVTGEWITVGRIPRRDAITQALEANLHLAGQLAAPRLVDKITRDDKHAVAAWIDRFNADVIPKRQLAATTLRQVKYHGQLVKASPLADMVIDRVDIIQIADFLKTYSDRGKERMALVLWSYLKDVFTEAIGAGWIRSKVNPVLHTTKPTPRVMRARLTLEAWQAIYAAAAELEPWVQRSMRLAMVSAQRLEDLQAAEFKPGDKVDVWTAESQLWVKQEKTKARLRIPYALRLDAIGCSLEEAIADCRDNVLSRRLIHHTRKHTKAAAGDPVHLNTLSKGFSKARDRSGLTWAAVDEAGNPQTPPTFHEQRSLAARLYEAQGGIDVQVLLGHRDPKTTAVYKDSRGAEWLEVKLA
jgi:integrase